MIKNISKLKGISMILLLNLSNNIYRKEVDIHFISSLIGCEKNDTKIFKLLQKSIFIFYNLKYLDNYKNYFFLKNLNVIAKILVLQSSKDKLFVTNEFYKIYHRVAVLLNMLLYYVVLQKKKSKIKSLWIILSILYAIIFIYKYETNFSFPQRIIIIYQYILILLFENENKIKF